MLVAASDVVTMPLFLSGKFRKHRSPPRPGSNSLCHTFFPDKFPKSTATDETALLSVFMKF
jgi:hypothetical protein